MWNMRYRELFLLHATGEWSLPSKAYGKCLSCKLNWLDFCCLFWFGFSLPFFFNLYVYPFCFVFCFSKQHSTWENNWTDCGYSGLGIWQTFKKTKREKNMTVTSKKWLTVWITNGKTSSFWVEITILELVPHMRNLTCIASGNGGACHVTQWTVTSGPTFPNNDARS